MNDLHELAKSPVKGDKNSISNPKTLPTQSVVISATEHYQPEIRYLVFIDPLIPGPGTHHTVGDNNIGVFPNLGRSYEV
ncbi:hypothetical protein RRG08_006995 [Elysia crispata]|uniref:Uncharacterized protein n=1 Tax=Elysia crispata TaxID=231223 RepID=A0AAE1A5B6_9GAST|nr:hypothetical protein RRG08_006995 [Elysia crispata]